MTPRTNLLDHAHELAGSATNLATHVGEVIGAAVGDAATVVADTATHVYETLASTIDEKTGRAPRRRRRGGLAVALLLALLVGRGAREAAPFPRIRGGPLRHHTAGGGPSCGGGLRVLTNGPAVAAGRRWQTSGRLLFTAAVAVLLLIPIGAHLLHTSADDPGRFSIVLWIGWGVCALLGAVVIVHALASVVTAPSAGLAMAFDALPLVLGAAWVTLIPAAVTRHWLLAACAASLCAYHLRLVVPRVRAAPTPDWVAGAPTFRLCVANVYIENPTPEDAARQLLDSGADVIVIVESTPGFMSTFDAVGGTERYPWRVADPDDTSDYAVTLAVRRELAPGSGPDVRGELRAIHAVVPVGDELVDVYGLNPMAAADRGGYRVWRRQLRHLRGLLREVRGPVVLAGDLNASQFRPEIDRLLAMGLRDAHDALGLGLTRSFALSNQGVLAKMPVARLDHALINAAVHPISVVELEAKGSDHVPFVVELAVRQGGRRRVRGRGGRRRRIAA